MKFESIDKQKRNFLSCLSQGEQGTLRYVLRSIETNVHFFGKLHLIVHTDDAVPPWLERSSPRLNVVTHEQLFAPELITAGALPTANSGAIESQLYRLANVTTPEFLYLNDDMFITRPRECECNLRSRVNNDSTFFCVSSRKL